MRKQFKCIKDISTLLWKFKQGDIVNDVQVQALIHTIKSDDDLMDREQDAEYYENLKKEYFEEIE